jgi:hypothetical protein
MLMTLRERLVSVKSQLSNAFRSYAAEFGIVGPAGRQNVAALIKRVRKWRGISSAFRRTSMPRSKLAWRRSKPS